MEPMNPSPQIERLEEPSAERPSHLRLRRRELNKFFKALSDETRRNILRLLERREQSVGEIVRNFDLSQPTISRHLSVLREADLVIDRRHGQHVIYRLNARALSDSARRFFGSFRDGRPDRF